MKSSKGYIFETAFSGFENEYKKKGFFLMYLDEILDFIY